MCTGVGICVTHTAEMPSEMMELHKYKWFVKYPGHLPVRQYLRIVKKVPLYLTSLLLT